jgi:zinc/manganese transport system ATP-binding protein
VTAGQQSTAQEILSVEGLGVHLDGRQVLDDVSVHVGAGQFTGLIGSNGAGKTTLFRVILGLTSAGAGEVLIAGRPRSRRNPLIGYVPQKFSLDPDAPLRARDLVALGVDGHRFGLVMPSRQRRAVVDEMLDAVNGRAFADTRVGLLSGGEQQRVLIAHALASRPKLLLLDEPLANLDLRSASEVVALVAGIARRQGLAVLISAHEINPLLPVMDQIVYLAAGRAVQGRTEDVITSEVLSRLYGHHVDVLNVHGRILVVADVGPRAGDDDAALDGSHVQIIA